MFLGQKTNTPTKNNTPKHTTTHARGFSWVGILLFRLGTEGGSKHTPLFRVRCVRYERADPFATHAHGPSPRTLRRRRISSSIAFSSSSAFSSWISRVLLALSASCVLRERPWAALSTLVQIIRHARQLSAQEGVEYNSNLDHPAAVHSHHLAARVRPCSARARGGAIRLPRRDVGAANDAQAAASAAFPLEAAPVGNGMGERRGQGVGGDGEAEGQGAGRSSGRAAAGGGPVHPARCFGHSRQHGSGGGVSLEL